MKDAIPIDDGNYSRRSARYDEWDERARSLECLRVLYALCLLYCFRGIMVG